MATCLRVPGIQRARIRCSSCAAPVNGTLNGVVNLPGANLSKTDAANWTINSTGNIWAFTGVLNAGSVRLGANNALAVGAILSIGQASDASNSLLEMNGFNQEVNGLTWNRRQRQQQPRRGQCQCDHPLDPSP
jgi:hypothetical protein